MNIHISLKNQHREEPVLGVLPRRPKIKNLCTKTTFDRIKETLILI